MAQNICDLWGECCNIDSLFQVSQFSADFILDLLKKTHFKFAVHTFNPEIASYLGNYGTINLYSNEKTKTYFVKQ